MRTWACSPILVLGTWAFFAAGSATAGGDPTELYFVGDDGSAMVVQFTPKTAAGLYDGRPTATPSGEYVQIFPSWFGLPGLPLRYFPDDQVLCGRSPDPSCRRASRLARRTLEAAATDGLRSTERPTVITSMTYRGEPVEPPNVWIGVELALAQAPLESAPSGPGIPVELRWRGPAADVRPERALLSEEAVTAAGKTFELLPGVGRQLAWNLPLPEPVLTAPSASSKGSQEDVPSSWAAIAIAGTMTALLVSLPLLAARRARRRSSLWV